MFQLAVRTWDRLRGRQARQPEGEEERRVRVRYPCNVETTLQPADGQARETLSARVQNVSLGGIKLVVSHRFEPGTLLSVDLPGGDPNRCSTVLAYVVHVTAGRPGEWAVGCTFAMELTDEDLQLFGAGRVKPGDPDQRSWVRFPSTAQARYQELGAGETASRPARVFNISPNGVGLLAGTAVDLGQLLTLDLHDGNGQSGFTILASVVRVSSQDNGEWALGCNFIRELNDAELRALL